jgi:hypothetical protein
MGGRAATARIPAASERVERETTAGANSVEDARRAFDNLFKK